VKVSSQRIPDSQVLLEVEVDEEQMEKSLERAYRRLVQQIEVPGFRKGKTPRNMLERHVGRDRLVREAIDILIPEAYSQALDKEQIDPIDQPDIELVNIEPLSFKATVPVRPTVELGDYQKLRVERDAVLVDEADADQAIDDLRHRYAVHEPVDRPVKTGDIVRADVRIVVEDQEVYHDEDVEFRLREGATIFLPGFAEGIVGAEKGVTREVEVNVPPGEQPLSGKKGTATVTVKEVKEERLPELNDEFAQEVGEGFPSLEALKERLRNDLRERLEAEAEEQYQNKVVAALVEDAQTIEFPPVLVDREIERVIQDQARSTGQDVESYLALIRKTAEEIREDLAPAATERVRRSLALGQLAEDEQVNVEPSEIDGEIERIVASAGPQAEQIQRLFSSEDARRAIERTLLGRKTMEKLIDIVGQDGAAEKPEAKKSRPKKATKKKAEKAEVEESS
jgi:trigger factor